jgi:hypothetical protein
MTEEEKPQTSFPGSTRRKCSLLHKRARLLGIYRTIPQTKRLLLWQRMQALPLRRKRSL